MSDVLPSKLDISLLNAKYAEYKREALNESTESEAENLKQTFQWEGDVDDDEDNEDEIPLNEDAVETLWKPVIRISFRLRHYWPASLGVILLLMLSTLLWGSKSNTQIIPNVSSFADISKSMQHLQWQINELNSKHKNKFQDLRNYLELKMEEVGAKFVAVDDEIQKLKVEQATIVAQLGSLSLEGVHVDGSKIPVLLDEHNNVQLLPEFQKYLQEYIQSTLSSQKVQRQFQLNFESFVHDYINEIVQSKVGFMNKEEILHLVTMQFQENKRKLIDEIKQFTQIKPRQEIPQKLIPKEYPKQDKVNYAQAANGARVINYLSSPTFKPRTKKSWWFSRKTQAEVEEKEDDPSSPFIVLTANDGVWRSTEVNATLGIKFLEPIYMSEFMYEHPRVQNSALLTSCPAKLSVYILSDQTSHVTRLSAYTETIGKYQKAFEMRYDLNEATIQQAEVPEWMKTVLVKSLVVRIEGNYGNEFFSSLYKLKVHGLTRLDVLSVDKLMRNSDVGESVKRGFRTSVKRFGDDLISA